MWRSEGESAPFTFIGLLLSHWYCRNAWNPLEIKAFGVHANFHSILKGKPMRYAVHTYFVILFVGQKKSRQSDKTSIYHREKSVFTCKYILKCVLGTLTLKMAFEKKERGEKNQSKEIRRRMSQRKKRSKAINMWEKHHKMNHSVSWLSF